MSTSLKKQYLTEAEAKKAALDAIIADQCISTELADERWSTISTEYPPYYGPKDDPLEPIKIIRHYGLNFSMGNVIKYTLRAGKKPGEAKEKDLKKALYYIKEELRSLGVDA